MAKAATAVKQPNVTDEDKAALAAKKAADAEKNAILVINKAALSVDVGPAVISSMSNFMKEEDKLLKAQQELNAKRYDVLTNLTMGCLKAAKNDPTINLAATFSGDVKQMNRLNDQLGLALGIREYVDVGDGKMKITYAKAVQKFFPSAKDKKDDPATIQKATLRTNYLHQLKKAAQAAMALIEKDIEAKIDSKAGTLRISGPAVQEAFGASEVVLNEKQKVQTEQGEVTLKTKPSFTALKEIAANTQNKTVQKRKDSRTQDGPGLDVNDALIATAKTLTDIAGKFKTPPNEKAIAAIKSLQSALDKLLKM